MRPIVRAARTRRRSSAAGGRAIEDREPRRVGSGELAELEPFAAAQERRVDDRVSAAAQQAVGYLGRAAA